MNSLGYPSFKVLSQTPPSFGQAAEFVRGFPEVLDIGRAVYIVNAEGKRLKLPVNHQASAELGVPILGNILKVSDRALEEWRSDKVSEEWMAASLMEMQKDHPELFHYLKTKDDGTAMMMRPDIMERLKDASESGGTEGMKTEFKRILEEKKWIGVA